MSWRAAGASQPLDLDSLARLDSQNLVQEARLVMPAADGDERYCVVPAKLVILRLLWFAVQRDGSYRTATGNGLRSNIWGGAIGAMTQLIMTLTILTAPHIVRCVDM